MCPELRNKEALHAVIKHFHARSLGLYELLEEEDDFQELLSPPPVMAATKYQLNLSYPDFSLHRVQVLSAVPTSALSKWLVQCNRAVNEASRSFPVSNLIPAQDLFRQLGPEAVFSAKHDWSPPRTVHLTRRQHGDSGDSNTQVQGYLMFI